MPIGVKKMKINSWTLLYVALLLFIVFVEYRQSDINLVSTTSHKYKIEENKALESLVSEYIMPVDFDGLTNKQWGIVLKKVKEKVVIKPDDNKTKPVEVTLKEKTLCIEKECLKLLGIFRGTQGYRVSFYGAKAKEKIKEFSKGEVVKEAIKIKEITHNEVLFSEINSTREWYMKLFDVNSSQYKPKEFE